MSYFRRSTVHTCRSMPGLWRRWCRVLRDNESLRNITTNEQIRGVYESWVVHSWCHTIGPDDDYLIIWYILRFNSVPFHSSFFFLFTVVYHRWNIGQWFPASNGLRIITGALDSSWPYLSVALPRVPSEYRTCGVSGLQNEESSVNARNQKMSVIVL